MSFRDFYKRQITVARIFGIPVRFDYRWFVVFFLSVWLIAVNLGRGGMFVGSLRLQPVGTLAAYTLGVITTLGLFLSVLVHELSHAFMGRAEGIEIEEIVLHPFGGLARLRNEPESPGAEFRIAIAGPAASFVIGIVTFVLLLPTVRSGYSVVAGVLLLICAGNLLLAIFNLFPGYPLDGGRVLRDSLAPNRRHQRSNATRGYLRNVDRRDLDHLRCLHGRCADVSFAVHGFLVGARRIVSLRRRLQCRETRAGAFAEHRSRSDVSALFNRAGFID